VYTATAFVLLIVPVATQVYDARYALCALGPLSVAAALAVDGVLGRRARPAPEQPGVEQILAAV
jgi:hypothetical protein